MPRQTNGIVIGIVTDLDDPERLGRVRVRYPHLDDQKSYWARLATLMAGPDRGTFFRPEVDDEVLVAFEHGDPRRPYILGGLWNSVDSPPSNTGQATENNVRLIKSRSGHVIKLDDTQGAAKIEVVDKNGSHKVVIDSANQKIEIVSDVGDVEVTANAGTVKVEALTVEIKATGNMNLEASGTMTIKGALVNIN
jgi:phage baseplate assembly protein V